MNYKEVKRKENKMRVLKDYIFIMKKNLKFEKINNLLINFQIQKWKC